MIFETQTIDHRVKDRLDALKLEYIITPEGNFWVIIQFDDERAQAAYISSKTRFIGDFEIREIWSTAYISEGFLDNDTANTLLLENQKQSLGAWRLTEEGNNSFLANFCVQVEANSSPNLLLQALGVVLKTADDMEEKLTGGDFL